MRPLHRRAVRALVTAALVRCVLGPAAEAHADPHDPAAREPRHRVCCALAARLPLHLGAAHVPVAMGIVVAPQSIGHHSYSGRAASRETNGVIYTRRGGFIDTGHTRGFADLTARIMVRLRPLLARGSGVLHLEPRDGELRVQIVAPAPVPEASLTRTSSLLAQRIAFQISIWVEITQYYGHTVIRGAEEMFSSFTPEDLYSNLFGAHLGAAAVESSLPYDRAMDILLPDALRALEATPAAETRRVLAALAGRWWRKDTPWPEPRIPIARSFQIGPLVPPMLAPPDVVPPAEPVVLAVPEVDADGAPLAQLYRLEIVPDLVRIPRFARAGAAPVITADDLPQLVDGVRRSIAAGDVGEGMTGLPAPEDEGAHLDLLAHYLVGLRMLDLKAAGGIAVPLSGGVKGVIGGSLVGVQGDTRGGDFSVVRFDAGHTAERGLIAGFTLLRSDALWFCHDRETGTMRAPLLSLLGPCAKGEWLGLGGSVAEAFHDGRTGRTAIRPLSLYGVLGVLGNGQSPSYDGVRVLLRAGGAVEHVWSQNEGGVTIPRVGGNAVLMARTPGRSLELYGATGYRLDPATPQDAGFESNLRLRWYFLLGGNHSAQLPDGIDPWGVGSLGLEGGYSVWTRPLHSFPDLATPFVSAERTGTWQLLLTATVGFEGLVF